MSNLGSGEILVVLLLALIVLGPERLPRAARQIGNFVRQMREMSSGFQSELRSAIDIGDTPFSPEESRIRPLPGATSLSARSVGSDEGGDESDLEADIRARNDDLEPDADAQPGAVAPDERAAG